MKVLSLTHLGLGILLVIHFAFTGQLMSNNYFAIAESNTLIRMMLRANHIYILFSGLLHLLISFTVDTKKAHWLYYGASLILLVATISLNISFYIDPMQHIGQSGNDLGRMMTNYSIKGVLVGTGLHLLLMLWQKIKTKKLY